MLASEAVRRIESRHCRPSETRTVADPRPPVETLSSIESVDPLSWDRLFDAGHNPCVSHAFLHALEAAGCVGDHCGWTPQHQIIRDDHGGLIAAAPVYLKTHSRGEFVFDWAWADALERAGHAYYPKLVCGVPFTPVPGPRIAGQPDGVERILDALRAQCARGEASSVHVLFPTTAPTADDQWLERRDLRYVWSNDGYADFDGFLAELTSKRRKTIRRERRRLGEQGIHFTTRLADDLDATHWQAVHALYARTYLIRGQRPYLTPEFFPAYAALAPGRVLLIEAHLDDRLLAVAIAIVGDDTLFGRHWGTAIDVDGLHFETCYYQGIEYCIEHRLTRYDAGVQGEQKRMRGFEPFITRSLHHIAHPGLRRAVNAFLAEERRAVADWAESAEEHSAFRRV
ncbi:GNAT family N-acetyltransferase [uncultured Abyssibacter sp.]|uniref:GNAT family N-acetyltransferase n=1 Tax=uncultured Abyssibacter sp. TaxID=2320202 RepID=UPI0032B101C8